MKRMSAGLSQLRVIRPGITLYGFCSRNYDKDSVELPKIVEILTWEANKAQKHIICYSKRSDYKLRYYFRNRRSPAASIPIAALQA
jgi:alanine racemase